MKRNCVVIAVLSMMMFGCVNQPYPQSQPQGSAPVIEKTPTSEVSQPPVSVTPTPEVVTPVVPVTNTAVESLVKQARAQYLAHDYQNAIATAERGLRIDRRAADLYLVLAQSYVQLALPQKATVFVQQGLRYAQQGSEAAQGLMRVQDILRQGN